MGPFVARKAENTPEHAERFDGPRGLRFTHVGRLPAELIEQFGDDPLARSSFPQINIAGRPPANCGSIMRALPTELNALTK
jgi:hypothetical protein